MSVTRLRDSIPRCMLNSPIGRICGPVDDLCNNPGGQGQDRLKGILEGLTRSAVVHAPAITQPHERRLVLRCFDRAYRHFYTVSGLQKMKKLEGNSYAQLEAVYATADADPGKMSGFGISDLRFGPL
jgi:hypothetical protein